MSLFRSNPEDDHVAAGPVVGLAGPEERRRSARSGLLAMGTLACERCDAPVAPPGPVAPDHPLDCPFCGHAARVRDFLSLEPPTRPARVAVRLLIP